MTPSLPTLHVSDESDEVMVESVQGTEGYLAPECYDSVLTSDHRSFLTRLTPAADVWSLGVTLLTMLLPGHSPPDTRLSTLTMILTSVPGHLITHHTQIILTQCLQRSAQLRPSVQVVISYLGRDDVTL